MKNKPSIEPFPKATEPLLQAQSPVPMCGAEMDMPLPLDG